MRGLGVFPLLSSHLAVRGPSFVTIDYFVTVSIFELAKASSGVVR